MMSIHYSQGVNLSMVTILTISPVFTYFHGKEGLHGEELGRPQLKVEAEAVEESPDEDNPARPKPQRRDAICAEWGDQLVQHIIMFTAEVIIHIPAKFTFSWMLQVYTQCKK